MPVTELAPRNRDCSVRRGFSLIELLVVISIIAMLVALLLPAMQRAREQARRTVCSSSVRQFLIGVHMYAQDYEDAPPAGAGYFGSGPSYYGRYGFNNVMRYILGTTYGLRDVSIWVCPSGMDPQRHRLWASHGKNYVTLNGNSYDNNHSQTSYGYIIGAGGNAGGAGPTQPGMANSRVTRISQTIQPSRRIVWWDAIGPDGTWKTPLTTWYASANNHHTGYFQAEGANYGFVDGHAEWRAARWGTGGNMLSPGTSMWIATEP